MARRIHALKAQVRLGTVQLELSIIQERAASGAARLAHADRTPCNKAHAFARTARYPGTSVAYAPVSIEGPLDA